MQDSIPLTKAYAIILDIPIEGYRAYLSQRRSAKQRGIEFLFSLPDWWKWWQANGWENRGRGRGKNVMARLGDRGAYEPGNVYSATFEANAAATRHWDTETWGDAPDNPVIRYPWG